MEYNDSIEACKKIHERARYLRGRFLNTVAVIERSLAIILTDYFCTSDPSKREIFFKDIVTSHSFSSRAKKDILVKIVKRDYPRYWDENKTILKDMDDIMTFRNKLAHSIIDVSADALSRPIEEGIGFIDWKEAEPITDKQFNDWEVKANMVTGCLSDIKRLLPFKEKPISEQNIKRD